MRGFKLPDPGLLFSILALGVYAMTAYADNQDSWTKRAVPVSRELAKGNLAGAARQAVPRTHAQLSSQTRVSADLGGVNLRQGLAPVNKLDTKYVDFAGQYQANVALGLDGGPDLFHALQVQAQNQYLKHSTTFLPGRLKKNS